MKRKFVKVKCNHYGIKYPYWFLYVSDEFPVNFGAQIQATAMGSDAIIQQFYDHGDPKLGVALGS